jgi:hypothetical protein
VTKKLAALPKEQQNTQLSTPQKLNLSLTTSTSRTSIYGLGFSMPQAGKKEIR